MTGKDAPSIRRRMMRILPDIAAYGSGLGLAWFMSWETADLVWSLWLSSLVLGYLSILAVLLGMGVAFMRKHWPRQDIPAWRPLLGFAIFLGPLAIFFLAFFSLHFCGFHAIHGSFLISRFPIEGLSQRDFSINPLLLWHGAVQHLLAPYGFFLIAALIAERAHLFRPLAGFVPSLAARLGAEPTPDKAADVSEMLGRPYANVMRLHLLILLFAALHVANLESFWIFALAYSFYFFPWAEVRDLLRRRHQAAAEMR